MDPAIQAAQAAITPKIQETLAAIHFYAVTGNYAAWDYARACCNSNKIPRPQNDTLLNMLGRAAELRLLETSRLSDG